MREIEILGAGISGLTAAINLAKAGYDIKVYEKAKYVGARHHGDFQGLENWTTEKDILKILEDIGIRTKFFHKPFKKVSWYPPSLREAPMSSDNPFFYIIRRGNLEGSLDKSLKKEAEDMGVEIEFMSKKGEKDCDIIATGPKKANIWAIGINFEADISDKVVGLLNNKAAPQGYAYLISINEKNTLATVGFRNSKLGEHYLEKAIKEFKKIYNFKIKNRKKFIGHGNFFIPKSGEKENKLYIGERIGFQDYLFGFGMKYAFLSGHLAAKSIIKNKDYDRLWRKEFLGELRSSLVSRFIFDRLNNKRYEYLVKRLQGEDERLVKRNYEFSWKKKLLYPIAKLMS